MTNTTDNQNYIDTHLQKLHELMLDNVAMYVAEQNYSLQEINKMGYGGEHLTPKEIKDIYDYSKILVNKISAPNTEPIALTDYPDVIIRPNDKHSILNGKTIDETTYNVYCSSLGMVYQTDNLTVAMGIANYFLRQQGC